MGGGRTHTHERNFQIRLLILGAKGLHLYIHLTLSMTWFELIYLTIGQDGEWDTIADLR